MYPESFFNLFPPFPRNNVGFVAMSFAPEFRARWDNVIEPAIQSLEIDGVTLQAHRVDFGVGGDSVLTEILDGISQCRLFLADISTIGYLDDKAIRNANVLYEVGLAQAIRLPEEVLLFRSDRDDLMFDVANIRVHEYDPDNDIETSRQRIITAINSSIKELDVSRHLAVRRAAESLSLPSWLLLMRIAAEGGLHHPETKTMGQALGAVGDAAAIGRLLDHGAISAEQILLTAKLFQAGKDKTSTELITYRITPFGRAIVKYNVSKMGFDDPNLAQVLEKMIQEEIPKS